MKNNDIMVIIPRKEGFNPYIDKSANTIYGWRNFSNTLSMMVSVSKRKSINQNVINGKQLQNLISSNYYNKFKSSKIFEDMIKIGNQINNRLIFLENKNPTIPISKGKNHFRNAMERYGDDLINLQIENAFSSFCQKYDYLPFGHYNNLNDFIIYIYETWELTKLSQGISMHNSVDDSAYKHFERYYYMTLNFLDIEFISNLANDYFDKWKKYGSIDFTLTTTRTIYDKNDDDEYFHLVIATEELALVGVYEAKNMLASLVGGRKYNVCINCHDLFRLEENQYISKSFCSIKCEKKHKANQKQLKRAIKP